MGQDLALKVVLRAQDLASGTVKGFGSSLGGLTGPAGVAVTALLAVGTAIIGVATQAAQMAADYQQQMNSVQALTGSNAQQMAFYDAQVKKLAVDAGEAPTKLASGLYNVLSASYKGADAMKILTLATEDAKIGLTDAATTSNALTNILRTFNVSAQDATRVNGEMLQTVTLGKATFAQYANNITSAASSSKQFGVSLETMNAAWATLTSTGISAGKATTDYTQLLSVMYANIGTVTRSLQKNGIAFDETKFNAMSFGDKVQYLNQVLQQATDKHVHITGVTKQAAQAIQAISGHIQNYNSNLAQLSDKQAMANKTQQAWAITQSGFNQQLARVQANIQVLLINIGQQLLPILTKIGAHVAPIITAFTSWVTKSHIVENTLAALGTVFNTVKSIVTPAVGIFMRFIGILSQVINWVQHNQTAMQAFKYLLMGLGGVIAVALIIPLLALTVIIAAVAVVIGVIIGIIMLVITIIKNWGNIMHWFGGIFSAIGTTIHNALVALVNGFLAPFRRIKQAFVDLYNHNIFVKMLVDKIREIVFAGIVWLQSAWNKATKWLGDKWSSFKDLMGKAWQAVSGLLSGAWNTYVSKPLQNLWNSIVGFVNGWPKNLYQSGINMIQSLINGMLSMIGKAGQAASNIMKNIAQFLGFHSPAAQGEGRYIIQWGNNMVKGFSSGVLEAIPQLQASVALAVRQGTAPMSGSPALVSVPYGRPPVSSSTSSYNAGSYTHNGDIVIHATPGMNTKDLAKEVENQLNRKFRRSGTMGNPAYGARNS